MNSCVKCGVYPLEQSYPGCVCSTCHIINLLKMIDTLRHEISLLEGERNDLYAKLEKVGELRNYKCMVGELGHAIETYTGCLEDYDPEGCKTCASFVLCKAWMDAEVKP
jgi:hypothetical protein